MRWFVEVSRVGEGSSSERFCLEAKAWQGALQEARKLRGDSGPLSKFSIELLEDGYRAVDPAQKVRYIVSKAPADAELLSPSPAVSSGSAASAPPAPGASSPAVSLPRAEPEPAASPSSAPTNLASAEPVKPSPSVPVTAAPEPPSPRMSARPGSSATPAASPSVPAGAGPSLSKPPTASIAPSASTAPSASDARGPSIIPSPNISLTRPVSVAPDVFDAAAEPPPPVSGKTPLPSATAPTPPAHRVLSSRIEPAKPDTPITYREEVYVVDPGTPRESVEVLLLERFQRVRSELAVNAPGQLIRLAVFDVSFEGRPPRVPLGTLSWKDWRGAPVLGFPSFGIHAPPMTSSMPPRPSEPVAVPSPPPNPLPGAISRPPNVGAKGNGAPPSSIAPPTPPEPIVPSVAPMPGDGAVRLDPARGTERPAERARTEAPARSEGPPRPDARVDVPARSDVPPRSDVPARASVPADSRARSEAPAPHSEAPVHVRNTAPSELRPRSEAPAVSPSVSAAPPPPPPPPPPPLSLAGGAAAPARRAAGDDLIAELFERLHELVFADGIVAGAAYVLDVLLELVPCEYALVQVFDVNTRRFIVVRARGPGLDAALLEATPDTDALIVEVMRSPQAIRYDAGADPRFREGRWRRAASPPARVLCGGVSQDGRYLGLIELANPAGGQPFNDNEVNALTYVCEQFAEFVATHPVVIDRDVVLGG